MNQSYAIHADIKTLAHLNILVNAEASSEDTIKDAVGLAGQMAAEEVWLYDVPYEWHAFLAANGYAQNDILVNLAAFREAVVAAHNLVLLACEQWHNGRGECLLVVVQVGTAHGDKTFSILRGDKYVNLRPLV